jgi:hypothetical protein
LLSSHYHHPREENSTRQKFPTGQWANVAVLRHRNYLFTAGVGAVWGGVCAAAHRAGHRLGRAPSLALPESRRFSGHVRFLLALFVPGLSGLLCIFMVLPLILPPICLGYVVTHLVRRYRHLQATDKVPVLLLPLALFLVAAPTETYFEKDAVATVVVTTKKEFAYSPMQVYNAIKAVDTLDAPKPFLMRLDLPVPTRCVLEKEAVGGHRTCYFQGGKLSNRDFGGGTITEQITALKKGRLLKMKVSDYNLVGRKWLGFREANYYFDSVGIGRCRMTRVTTYTSVLRPRAYWQPLEVLGIRQEPEYMFNNLAQDLQRKHGRR